MMKLFGIFFLIGSNGSAPCKRIKIKFLEVLAIEYWNVLSVGSLQLEYTLIYITVTTMQDISKDLKKKCTASSLLKNTKNY